MKVCTFMRINSRGVITLCKKPPRLGADEISVDLKIIVPDRLFQRPRLKATTSVEGIPEEVTTVEVAAKESQP